MGSPHHDYAPDFRDRRDTSPALCHGARYHRGHACPCRGLVKHAGPRVAPDEIPHLVRDLQSLEHADAAAIAGPAASLATLWLKDDVACGKAAQLEARIHNEVRGGELTLSLAAVAEHALRRP